MHDSFFALCAVTGVITTSLACMALLSQAKTIRALRDLVDKLHDANKRRLEDVCIPPASYPRHG